jgi:hypothetical protein
VKAVGNAPDTVREYLKNQGAKSSLRATKGASSEDRESQKLKIGESAIAALRPAVPVSDPIDRPALEGVCRDPFVGELPRQDDSAHVSAGAEEVGVPGQESVLPSAGDLSGAAPSASKLEPRHRLGLFGEQLTS